VISRLGTGISKNFFYGVAGLTLYFLKLALAGPGKGGREEIPFIAIKTRHKQLFETVFEIILC
jgi:hypothetical protein